MSEPYIEKAIYRCDKCHYQWTQHSEMLSGCRACGWLYVTWVNHPINTGEWK